jgi:AraC-like DNA-binding protein
MGNSAQPTPVLAASTRAYTPRERFDHFCDALCDVYLGIRPERTTPRQFDADVLAYAYGDAVISRIRAPGHDARRDRHAIAAKPDDALFLNVSTSTASTAVVDGRVHALAPATPVLLDNAETFHLSFDPSRRLSLYSLKLPRMIAGHRIDAAAVAAINDRMLSHAGRQLALQLRLMSDAFDADRADVAGSMVSAVTALLGVMAAPAALEYSVDRLSAYKTTARTHLDDPDFGVHDVASIHRVSVRSVQSAFASAGETFSGWMLAERLDLARDRLADPIWMHRPVDRIAIASGIRDASGFYKAFRARFGETPGAFRPV